MDYKDLTAILLKTAATVMLMWFAASLPAAATTVMFMFLNPTLQWGQPGMSLWATAAYTLLQPLTGIALSLLVFLFPRSVTNKLVEGAPVSPSPRMFEAIQTAALRVVGIYFVYRGIVDIVYFLVKMYARDANYVEAYGRMTPVSYGPDDLGGLVSSVVEVLFALWLLLGARGILGLVDRVRGRGIEKE